MYRTAHSEDHSVCVLLERTKINGDGQGFVLVGDCPGRYLSMGLSGY